LQTQVGEVRFWSAEQKPYWTSRRLRLMACRFAAQFLGLGRRPTRATPAPGEQGVQFTAPSHEHVANRDLGTVEHVNSNGDLRIGMDSGQEVRFNVRQHPHLDYGYAVTSDSSQGQTADRVRQRAALSDRAWHSTRRGGFTCPQ